MELTALESSLGYVFRDKSLLRQALTHPSVDNSRESSLRYERLEFLGDAVLELAVTQELFARFPQADEGDLTRMRATVVSRKSFGEVAASLRLEDYLIMGAGADKAIRRIKTSVAANTFESIFGAMVLDAGYEPSRAVALRILKTTLDALTTQGTSENPKGSLQEVLQAIYNESPAYADREIGTPEDPERFEATVCWRGQLIGTGRGARKKRAEEAAAADALARRLWESDDFVTQEK